MPEGCINLLDKYFNLINVNHQNFTSAAYKNVSHVQKIRQNLVQKICEQGLKEEIVFSQKATFEEHQKPFILRNYEALSKFMKVFNKKRMYMQVKSFLELDGVSSTICKKSTASACWVWLECSKFVWTSAMAMLREANNTF
jgi:hypothetical protein